MKFSVYITISALARCALVSSLCWLFSFELSETICACASFSAEIAFSGSTSRLNADGSALRFAANAVEPPAIALFAVCAALPIGSLLLKDAQPIDYAHVQDPLNWLIFVVLHAFLQALLQRNQTCPHGPFHGAQDRNTKLAEDIIQNGSCVFNRIIALHHTAGSNFVNVNASTYSSSGTPYCNPRRWKLQNYSSLRGKQRLPLCISMKISPNLPSSYSPVRKNTVCPPTFAFWVYPFRRVGFSCSRMRFSTTRSTIFSVIV